MINKKIDDRDIRKQVRVLDIPRKINSGKDRGKYELDIAPIDIKKDGKIIEGDKETIIVPEETIMEMVKQAKGLFEDSEKEDEKEKESEKIMYG